MHGVIACDPKGIERSWAVFSPAMLWMPLFSHERIRNRRSLLGMCVVYSLCVTGLKCFIIVKEAVFKGALIYWVFGVPNRYLIIKGWFYPEVCINHIAKRGLQCCWRISIWDVPELRWVTGLPDRRCAELKHHLLFIREILGEFDLICFHRSIRIAFLGGGTWVETELTLQGLKYWAELIWIW